MYRFVAALVLALTFVVGGASPLRPVALPGVSVAHADLCTTCLPHLVLRSAAHPTTSRVQSAARSAAKSYRYSRGFTSSDSLAAITSASRRWGVSYWWLYRVARCESSFNPYAVNPSPVWNGEHAQGLFQFIPSTFYAYARRIGEYRFLYNPYAAANVAGYMFSVGQARQWACN